MGKPYVTDVPLAACDPPHRVTHDEKAHKLSVSMARYGGNGPCLVGYRTAEDRVQLLSGSHRYAAATSLRRATVPVQVYPEWFVQALWGTEDWTWLMTPST